MQADIIKQMRAEEADLSRKLQAVRDFLAAYGERPKESRSEEAPQSKQSAKGSRSKSVPIESFTENTRTSVALALMLMATSEGLVKTADLVRGIDAMGHKISGANKINSLGALLARSEDVEGHGKSGWTVYDRENAIALARKYAGKFLGDDSQKENEPERSHATGSETAGWGARTPPPASENPLPSWRS